MLLPYMCQHAKFHCSRLNPFGVGMGSQKIWGCWALLLEMGTMADPLERCFSFDGVAMQNSVLGQTTGA